MTKDDQGRVSGKPGTKFMNQGHKLDAPPASDRKGASLTSSSQRIQDQLNFIFVLFFGIGVVGTFAGNWYIPAGAVAIYFLIGLRITRNQINQDKFADSLYYMGFLLTLWALFFGLGLYAPTVEQLDSTKITRQFGIALITTVLGLMFRIILIQFRRTVSGQEEEAREGISLMVNALMTEVENAITAVRDAKETLTKEASAVVTSSYAEVTTRLRTAGEGVEQAAHTLKEKIEAVDIDPDLLNKRLHPAAEQLISEVQRSVDMIGAATMKVSERIESIDIDPDLLSSQLRPATEKLSAEIGQATGAIHNATGILQESARQSNQRLNRIGETAMGVSKSVQSLSSALKDAVMSVAELHARNQEATAGIEELMKAAGQFDTVVGQQQSRLKNSLNDYDSNVSRAAKEFTKTSNEAAASIGALKDTVVESVELLRDEIERESNKGGGRK